LIRFIYYTLRFIIITTLLLAVALLFTLEHPDIVLTALKRPLSDFNISIGRVEGNIFSGLDIKDINYQDKVKLDRFKFKLDWNALEQKTLEIDDIRLKNIYVEENFLDSLLKSDNSEKEQGSIALPIDINRVVIKRAEVSFGSVEYQKGEIGNFSLGLNGLDLRVDINSSMPLKSASLRDLNISANRLFYEDFRLNLANIYLKDLDIRNSLNSILLNRANIVVDDFKYPDYKLKYSNIDLDSLNLKLKLDSTSTPLDMVKLKSLDLRVDEVVYDKFRLTLAKALVDRVDINDSLKSISIDGADIKLKDFDYIDTKLKYSKLNLDTLKLNLDENMSLSNIFLKESNLIVDSGKYQEYNINYGDLKLHGANSNLKEYEANLSLKLNSNIANGNLKGRVKDSFIDFKGDITPKSSYLARFLKDSGVKLKRDATIHISKLKGDYKRDLDFDLKLDNLSLVKDEYSLKSKKLLASGNYSIEKSALDLKLDTVLNSNIGKLSLKGDTSLDLDDLNNTIKYNIKSKIDIKREFLAPYLDGIDLKRLSTINLKLSGDFNNTLYYVNSNSISIKKDDISLNTPITLRGRASITKGDVSFKVSTKPKSNLGFGKINSSGSFNFKDFKPTFKHKTALNITPNRGYINKFLKEQNITLVRSPNVEGVVSGDLENVDISALDTKLKLLYQKSILNIALKVPKLKFNTKSSNLKGSLSAVVTSSIIKFSLKSRFAGDIKKIEDISSDSSIKIEKFKGFGVDLTPLTPIAIDLNTKNRSANFKLNSKRLKIVGESRDFDSVSLKINSKKLYLYKMVSLPPELEHKYIMLDLSLDGKLSTKYIDLRGYIYSNKGFKTYLKLLNSTKKGFNARVDMKHLKLIAKGNLDKNRVVATLDIDSISDFQKEISKMYNFKVANIDGKVTSKLIFNGDEGNFKLSSPKLELNGFDIKEIAFDADYKDKLITLNRATWRVSGFSNKKFNKKFYLKRKGKIYLGDKKYIDIEFSPDISIEAREGESGLEGELRMSRVPLAHPDYGSAFLSCDISYREFDGKREISGDVDIKYMQIFYEAKFLEADYDPDIVVVTKKKKKIKDELESNDFIENTKIDVAVRASQANYRTPDIDLTFDVDVNVYKDFGRKITLLGRIEDINGHVDQTPKRFLVKNSNIVFQGGEEINPLLDIRVEYELPQVLIEIYIGGYANRPKIEFSSEPPMPKKDIMSYLLFGVSTKKLADGEGSLSKEAELFILNQLARDFAYEFKLDRIFIKDDGTGEGYAVEIGKRVGRKNMIIIESSKAGNSYIIERDISKHLKLRIGEHLKEHQSQSIDIFFRKKFK